MIKLSYSQRCYVPTCDAEDSSYNESFLEITSPQDDGGYSQCSMYRPANDSVVSMYRPANDSVVRGATAPLALGLRGRETSPDCRGENFDDSVTIDCPDGYVYDKSFWESSATTEVSFMFFFLYNL